MTFSNLPVELVLHVSSFLPDCDKQCLRLTCRGFKELITRDRIPCGGGDTASGMFSEASMSRRDYLPRLFREGNIFAGRVADFKACGGCLKIGGHDRFPMSGFKIDDMDICADCIGGLFLDATPSDGEDDMCWNCCEAWNDCAGFPLYEMKPEESDSEEGDWTYWIRRTCSKCIVDLARFMIPKGHKQRYNGVDYYTCVGCYQAPWDEEVYVDPRAGERLHMTCTENELVKTSRFGLICEGCHWNTCTNFRECKGWPLEIRYSERWWRKVHDVDCYCRCFDCAQWHPKGTECYLWKDINETTGVDYDAFPPAAGPPKRQLTLDPFLFKQH